MAGNASVRSAPHRRASLHFRRGSRGRARRTPTYINPRTKEKTTEESGNKTTSSHKPPKKFATTNPRSAALTHAWRVIIHLLLVGIASITSKKKQKTTPAMRRDCL